MTLSLVYIGWKFNPGGFAILPGANVSLLLIINKFKMEAIEVFTDLKKSAKKKRKIYWWLAAFVAITTTCIANFDKLIIVARPECYSLKKELHKQERRLKSIQQQIELLNGNADLKLSADSLTTALRIADIFSKLNNAQCDN